MSYSIDDLKVLMARLRDPETGCPWDARQTFKSIVPHTLEEAHEVADAIERESHADLKDELGDLLFQVIFYAQIGAEEGHFSFDSVVDNLVRKLVRRHPHVFPEGTLESRIDPDNRPDEAWIKESWERIKAEERAQKQMQDSLARHGFDWPNIEPVFDKLHEEIDELKEAWQAAESGQGDLDAVEDELGDLLFVCVNLARFMKVNPEQAVGRTNHKFEARFRAIEQVLELQGRSFDEETLEALDEIWQSVKGVEKKN